MNRKVMSKVTSGVLLCTMFAYTSPVLAGYTKEETVYSKLNGEGNTYQTIVNSHIKNTDKENFINDLSDLMNIKNINGNEEFTQDGQKYVWKTEGEDLYYQGESEKELPIECKVTYELDGKEISAKELAGKSGKVTLKIEYINKEAHSVLINGKEETLYTPFVAVCGTIVNNENHKNITINSGKLIDQGNKTIIIGISLPGMQESLGLSEEILPISNMIEITMDVTDFELNNFITYVTPNILEDHHFEMLDKLDEIYDKVNTLQKSSKQLVEGSEKLREGSQDLNNGTKLLSYKLYSAMNEYDSAKAKYTSSQGKAEIEKKIVAMINSKLKEMLPELEKEAQKEAVSVIRSNKTELENATVSTAKKYTELAVQEKLNQFQNNNGSFLSSEQEAELQTAIEQIIKKEFTSILTNHDYQGFINAVETAMKTEAKKAVTNAIDNEKISSEQLAQIQSLESLPVANQDAIIDANFAQYAPFITAVRAQSGNQITKLQALQIICTVSNATLSQAESKINSKIDSVSVKDAEMIQKQVQAMVESYVESVTADLIAQFGKENLETIQTTMIQTIVSNLQNEFQNNQTIQGYEAQIKQEVASSIDAVATATAKELAASYTEKLATQIANNLIEKQLKGELTSSELDKELSKYESMINEKLNTVDSSMDSLKSALNQLTNGTESLADGATKLSKGMKQFDEEGIQKIASYVNGDVKDVTARIEKLQELSEEYNNFTMLEDGNEGKVKFILMMDAIKKENAKEMIVTDGNQPSEKKEEESK